jgi:class 3 adenylate cyclase
MCGADVREAVADRSLRLRIGVHTGEVEWAGGNIRGREVHVAARVMAESDPGELLVTEITRSLAGGWDFEFEDRGLYALKGVEGTWRLSALLTQNPSTPSHREQSA